MPQSLHLVRIASCARKGWPSTPVSTYVLLNSSGVIEEASATSRSHFSSSVDGTEPPSHSLDAACSAVAAGKQYVVPVDRTSVGGGLVISPGCSIAARRVSR